MIRPGALDVWASVEDPLTVSPKLPPSLGAPGEPPWRAPDPLSQVFHYLRVSAAFTCRSELRAPFGLRIPVMPGCVWYHAVVRGTCLVLAEGGGSVRLASGELALVPHGVGHRVASDPSVHAPNVVELPQEMVSPRYSILRHGGEGEPCLLICGAVRMGHPMAAMLTGALPPILRVEAHSVPRGSPLDATLDLLLREAPHILPGGETVVTRLAEVLVVQLLRAWLEHEPPGRQSLVSGLRDPRIGRALALVHDEPGADLRLETLARMSGMSRSAFAARFVELVGMPAAQYVTEARMRLAEELLRGESLSLAEVSARVGYGSEAAFSRAFKRIWGVPPGHVRRPSAANPKGART
jgi:AraC-like DNA-binding protein